MKVIVSNDLRSRLKCAASNGSVIAKDLLVELKKNNDASDIIRGKANYFTTKKKKSSESSPVRMRVIFTGCNKDLTNINFPDRNNPEAPWLSENRTDLDPSTFVKLFKNLPEYSDSELTYFASAICINSKVYIDIYNKISDFIYAYSVENYSNVAQYGDCPLHNSCMRHDFLVGKVGDFYYNFAGAKIIVAKTNEGAVLGRAILWENASFKEEDKTFQLPILDRVYYSHTFINNMIINYAKQKGIILRRMHNDATSSTSFIFINELSETNFKESDQLLNANLSVKIPASKWYKGGAPYLDTFFVLDVTDNGEMKLSNIRNDDSVFTLRNTDGSASIIRRYCPLCGSKYYSDLKICDQCYKENTVSTVIGTFLTGKLTKYQGELIPKALIKRGKPTTYFKISQQLEKFI